MEISVVIPLFNKKETIGRALDSIRSQTHQPREIVVVNDGSTDGSEDTVLSMNVPGLRIIGQENAGVSAARNKGIAEARNEWIAFLDADDEWSPDFLSKIVRMQNDYPDYDLFATAYFSGDYQGNKSGISVNRIGFKGDYGVLHNYFEVASCSAPPIWSSAVCIRRSALKKIGGFPHGVLAGEDLITWARLAAHKDPVYCIEPLSVFWKEKSHTYEDLPKRVPQAEDPVGNALLEIKHNSEKNIPFIDKYIALWFKMRASIYLRFGMRSEAMRESLKSLYHDPSNVKIMVYIILCGMPKPVIRKAFQRLGH